jgi:plasmid stabilization system protein ParE
MSYRVAFLEDAELDMNDIEEYLSEFYESTVRDFFAELKEKVLVLEDTPYICQAYDEDPFFRQMYVKDYRLFYSIDDKRQLVIIHRIFHGTRDINQQLTADRKSDVFLS